MRVLLVSPAAQLGGAERCLLDCVAALRRSSQRLDVGVLSLADGPLLQKAQALGATVQVVEPPPDVAAFGESGLGLAELAGVVLSTPAALRFVLRLRSAIEQARADVVHTNGMKAHLLASAVVPASTRLVVHLHDFVGPRRASKWLLPALARRRKRVTFIANSQAVAADFARLAPEADVRTVYNVVDTDYFSPGPCEADWLASCAGTAPLKSGTVSFGLVATYARWKGHELFIEAAGRLRAAHPEAPLHFYVVGGPIYETRGSQLTRDDLLRWAKRAGIEDCIGLVHFQDDIARVYRALNVVVHASTQPEPFGRTIVEAMACAKPVVVSNAGGAAELFQHGKNALGFLPGDAKALQERMSALLDAKLRHGLAEAAHEHARESFGPGRLSEELLAVYNVGAGNV
jgi:glycosyltransferase involved in cell wall biosynthesis